MFIQIIIGGRMDFKNKIDHLKKLGLTGDFSQIELLYQGEDFNTSDETYQKLIKLSEKKCAYLDKLNTSISLANVYNHGAEVINDLEQRKKAVLMELFPDGGEKILLSMPGLKVVIGMVDIGGLTTFNKDVVFYPSSIVKTGNYTLIGSHVTFGHPDKNSNHTASVGMITLGDDTWIGSKVAIEDNAIISNGVVIAMGARVKSNTETEPNALYISNPAHLKTIIDKNYHSNKDNLTSRSNEEIEFILENLRKNNIDGDMTEYIKALKGQDYNCLDPIMSKLLNLSHYLVDAYNHGNLSKDEENRILNLLFPVHGKNFKVGKGLFVELLGAPRFGDNVTIGDNAFIAGNISIGNNVHIGNNACFSAIGHSLVPEQRHIVFNSDGSMFDKIIIGKILIASNISIGNNVSFVPGSCVTENISNNSLVLPGDKVLNLEQQ